MSYTKREILNWVDVEIDKPKLVLSDVDFVQDGTTIPVGYTLPVPVYKILKDTVPTASSLQAITSGGVFTALQGVGSILKYAYNWVLPTGNTLTNTSLIGKEFLYLSLSGEELDETTGTPIPGEFSFDTNTGIFTFGRNVEFNSEQPEKIRGIYK